MELFHIEADSSGLKEGGIMPQISKGGPPLVVLSGKHVTSTSNRLIPRAFGL
jgi:hypothetical protein